VPGTTDAYETVLYAQARILLDMAKRMRAKRDAEQLIERANEYQMLADVMPDGQPATPEAPPPSQTQSQPMQQQQQRQKDEDE
jgi:hypothetical protein